MRNSPGSRAWSGRLPTMLVLILFVFMCAAVLIKGLTLGGDSVTYLDGADRLRDGRPLLPVQKAYPGYVFVLSLSKYLGVSLVAVVILHLLMAGSAGLALFWLGRDVAGVVTGIAAAGLFLANPDIVRWHGYILTESLYISLVILTTWATWRGATRGGWWYGAAIVAAGLAAAVRPTGWLLLPIVGAFLVLRRFRGSLRGVLASFLTLIALAAVVLVNPIAQDRIDIGNPSQKIQDGVVIPGHQPGWVDMPAADGKESDGTLQYAIRNPAAVARLALTRIGTELAGVRPYYSTPHNAFLVGWLSLVYVTAAWGFALLRTSPITGFIVAVVLAHLAFVGVAFATYDGRFLLYILPLIGLFSGRCISELGTRRRQGQLDIGTSLV